MESHNITCLGLDLPAPVAEQIETHLPLGHDFQNRSVRATIDMLDTASGRTIQGLVLVTLSTWEALDQNTRDHLAIPRSWQFVLVIDQPGASALDHLARGHFLTVLTCPVDTEKITRVLTQAEEVTALYHDIFMMAKEISLERELLARKNEQLSFLNQLLTTASQSLDPVDIISACATDLNLLLEVKSLFGICWDQDGEQVHAEIFLPGDLSKEYQEQWISHLLSVAKRYTETDVRGYQVSYLATAQGPVPPEYAQLITQPLLRGDTTFGVLVICSEEAQTLGQDRLQTLNAAASHLSLAIRNGLEYNKLKAKADHDGLTRISNRQHFDMRLREEMKRHQRHHQELSLLMLDLDFFKSVNDTYGHLAGDMVLREVGKILRQTLRESDFPARYGGEEFVIILPQTREEQAWLLAERIRKIIAQTVFRFQNKRFRVTASLGIAGLKPGALTPAEMLIHEADQALYRAKTNGRNMVCSSALEDMASAN